MKYPSLTLFLLFCANGLIAQSTINATGGGGVISSNSYDYSIGEMALVSTYSSSSIVVTQGILQPKPASTSGTSTLINENELLVFPNPTTAIVYLQPQFKREGKISMELYDLQGRLIFSAEETLAQGSEQQQIDLNSFSAGNYILSVKFNESQGSYTIQKK